MGDPDPMSVVPYNDPYDTPIDLDSLKLTNDSIARLATLSPINHRPPVPQEFTDDMIDDDHDDLFNDPVILELFSQFNTDSGQIQEAGPTRCYQDNTNDGQNQEVGPSRGCGYGADDIGRSEENGRRQEQNENGRNEQNFRRENVNDGKGIPIAVWPPAPVPFLCTYCQVLREIIHTDGIFTAKLEVHGRLGIISHAVLEIRDHVNAVSPVQHRMYDFCHKSPESVKQFLQKYCENRKKEGCMMVPDPLSDFYSTLSVGFDWGHSLSIDDFSDISSPTSSDEGQPDRLEPEEENESERVRQRSNFAQQRERARRMRLQDFADYFHLPISKAAKRINLCATVVKRICRRDGLARWPYRKVKAIQKQKQDFTALLNSSDPQERAQAKVEIEKLEQELAGIFDVGGAGA